MTSGGHSSRGAGLLAAVMALAVAAPAALGPRYGGELTVGVHWLPTSPEPHPPRGLGERMLLGLVHETLVGIDPGGFPTPGLAATWTSAAEGREWTFELRQARFHDGRPLRSEHALLSLRRFLRESSPAARALADRLEGGEAFRRRESDDLSGILAPEPRRLVLRLREPQALPFAPLAADAAAITGAHGAGCGPFVPTLPLGEGDGLVLTAFPAHHRGRPYLHRLRLMEIPEPQRLHGAFQRGQIQIAEQGESVAALAGVLMLRLDVTRAPFDTLEHRVGFAGTVDRRELVEYFLQGGDPAYSLLPPPLLAPLEPSPPVRGAELAGEICLAVATDVPRPASQRVVAHLTACGLRVRVTPVEPSRVHQAAADARLFVWFPEVAEAGLALAELAELAPPPDGFLASLQAAEAETTLDRRRVLLHRAESLLRGHAALIPLAAVRARFQARADIHQLRIERGGRLVLEDAWVEP